MPFTMANQIAADAGSAARNATGTIPAVVLITIQGLHMYVRILSAISPVFCMLVSRL